MLHMTWPLPTNLMAQIPGKASSHFVEELEAGRQDGKFEPLT